MSLKEITLGLFVIYLVTVGLGITDINDAFAAPGPVQSFQLIH